MGFVRIARCSDVPENEARTFDLGGNPVAVFHAGGQFYACRNVCPHRGGPLGEGDFDGRIVTCPWHGWQFDVTTGINVLMPAARVEMYPVKTEGEDLLIALP